MNMLVCLRIGCTSTVIVVRMFPDNYLALQHVCPLQDEDPAEGRWPDVILVKDVLQNF